jgi:hypothetical protein
MEDTLYKWFHRGMGPKGKSMRSCHGRTFEVEGGGMKTQRRRYNYVTRIQAVAPQRWRESIT